MENNHEKFKNYAGFSYYMARDKSVRMPSSSAGITSYSDEVDSNFHYSPGTAILIIAVLILLVAALHYFGPRLG